MGVVYNFFSQCKYGYLIPDELQGSWKITVVVGANTAIAATTQVLCEQLSHCTMIADNIYRAFSSWMRWRGGTMTS